MLSLALALVPALVLAAPVARADAPDLTGTWGLEIDSVSATKVPVVGELKSTTRTFVLLELSRDQAAEDQVVFEQQHRVCAAEAKGGLVKTRVPKGYVAAVALKNYPAVLRPDGDGWSYDADTRLFSIGYDRACGQVPSDPADACVQDPDGDGKPGVTVHAKAPAFPWVEVYVAQQAHPVLKGRVVDGDSVAGGMALKAQTTHVLGASNSLFASSPSVRPLSEESTFRMERLAQGAGCAEVLSLFGGETPVD